MKSAQPPTQRAPSPQEIEAGKSPRGGWTRATLATWGIGWPPRRHWKRRLIQQWRREQRRLAEERWKAGHPDWPKR